MVIVILGILAAVVVFAVGGINDKGKTSACKADKSSIETAEEAYYAQNGVYVPLADLVPKYLHEVPTIHDALRAGRAELHRGRLHELTDDALSGATVAVVPDDAHTGA